MARRTFRADDGATLVEYALLVACVAIVVVGTVALLGTRSSASLSTSASALATNGAGNGGNGAGGNGQGNNGNGNGNSGTPPGQQP